MRIKRFFAQVDPNTREFNGRYTGFTPKQAASKAFTNYIRSNRINPHNIIFIKETTRMSKNKIYKYTCMRVRNDQQVIIGNRNVTYRYVNKLYMMCLTPEEKILFGLKTNTNHGEKKNYSYNQNQITSSSEFIFPETKEQIIEELNIDKYLPQEDDILCINELSI